MSFPPIPAWDQLHPIAVHFPIALLLVTPVFLLATIVFRRDRKALARAAFVLMLLGTSGAWVAVSTGEAAEELADQTPAAHEILEKHEHLGGDARVAFTFLTLGWALFLVVPAVLRREVGINVWAPATLVYLFFYLWGASVLANAAHEGGRLVHEAGVRAWAEHEEN
jgi:uncharacterized membrane protein